MADPTADPTDPGAPRAGPVSPDEESQYAFARQQADSQQRGQVQAAFDTLRMRRAFVNGVLQGGTKGAARALRESSLGQNLEGAAPAQP